jgi:hypothetical protein
VGFAKTLNPRYGRGAVPHFQFPESADLGGQSSVICGPPRSFAPLSSVGLALSDKYFYVISNIWMSPANCLSTLMMQHAWQFEAIAPMRGPERARLDRAEERKMPWLRQTVLLPKFRNRPGGGCHRPGSPQDAGGVRRRSNQSRRIVPSEVAVIK